MQNLMMKHKKHLQATLLAAALLCTSFAASASLAPANAYAAEQVETPRISVSASAVIEVAPDTATIVFDVNGKGQNTGTAATSAASKMEKKYIIILSTVVLSLAGACSLLYYNPLA